MICLILARGGSKGVPKKNIKPLNGKPLIHYVIEAAKRSELIKDIYVSTDCEEIWGTIKHMGVKLVKRPKKFATDESTDIESFIHFCETCKVTQPIVHLRATTPIINPKVIDSAINFFNLNVEKYSSLRSVHELSETIYKFYHKEKDLLNPIFNNHSPNGCRQGYPKTFVPNGYVDIVKPEIFIPNNEMYGNTIYGFETEMTYEIDTIDNFNYIEYLLQKNDTNKKNIN
jgi:CMP-N,N'-diacetyllegionaminic acid synthase